VFFLVCPTQDCIISNAISLKTKEKDEEITSRTFQVLSKKNSASFIDKILSRLFLCAVGLTVALSIPILVQQFNDLFETIKLFTSFNQSDGLFHSFLELPITILSYSVLNDNPQSLWWQWFHSNLIFGLVTLSSFFVLSFLLILFSMCVLHSIFLLLICSI
jgi:hypothetical protein